MCLDVSVTLHSLLKDSMDSNIIRSLSLHAIVCIANYYKPLHSGDCIQVDR